MFLLTTPLHHAPLCSSTHVVTFWVRRRRVRNLACVCLGRQEHGARQLSQHTVTGLRSATNFTSSNAVAGEPIAVQLCVAC